MGDAAIHVHSPAAAPRILRALPAQLSPNRLAAGASVTAVSAAVAHHNLLCETADAADASSRAEADVVRAHAAALDAYVAHVESLAESSRPDPSKHAAATLLGQLCRDCAPRRFVTSFARWGAALVALVKPDKDSRPTPVALAAARAIRHLLDRAASMMDVPGVRKEAAVVAQRASTAAARWLDDDDDAPSARDDPSVAADALALIRAALVGHPAALRPRVDALERTLIETMCLADDPAVVAAAVECVVATPRAGAVAGASAGDGAVADAATAWSSLARRLAIAAHDVLDVALRGAEPTDAASSARATLLPPGETRPPPPLGGASNPAVAGVDGAHAVFRATRLFDCFAALLRAPFPNAAAAAVPADVVLALATRAASRDGAAVSAAPGLPTVAIPAETLAALPALHVAAANLLAALVRCGGGALCRLAGPIARRVDANLRASGGNVGGSSRGAATCASTRVATYALAAAAARAFGPAAAANELAAVVIPAAAADAVAGWCGVGAAGGGDASGAADAAKRAAAKPGASKKRKKGGAWGQAGAEEMEAFLAAGGLLDRRGGVAGGSAGAAAYAVRAAALDALDAALVAGGAATTPRLRTLADAAVAEAAAAAVAAATAATSTAAFVEATSPAAVAARRAAYDALLTSALAPRAFRPENLPLAIAAFRAAKRADPALGDHAAKALLALEAMMHPAAPPLHSSAIAPPRAERNPAGGMPGLVAAWGDEDRGGGFGGFSSDRGGLRTHAEPNWGGEDDDESEEEEEEEEEGERVGVEIDVEGAVEGAEEPSAPPAKAARTTKPGSEPPAKVDTREPEPAEPDAAEPEPEVSPTTRSTRGRSKAASAPEPTKAPAKASKPKRLTAKEKRAAAAAAEAEAAAAAKPKAAEANKPARVGLGLGSGKAAVALQLSDDDSDGELPEIVDEEDE